VLDLSKVWEQEQDKHRFTVQPEDVWLSFSWDSPHPISVVWEYLTTPRMEKIWAGYDRVERTDSIGGRMQQESTYHCAHGELEFFNKILDWKAFEYVTIEQYISVGIKLIETRRVSSTGNGTQIVFDVGTPESPVPEETKQFLDAGIKDFVGKMLKKIDEDLGQK